MSLWLKRLLVHHVGSGLIRWSIEEYISSVSDNFCVAHTFCCFSVSDQISLVNNMSTCSYPNVINVRLIYDYP